MQNFNLTKLCPEPRENTRFDWQPWGFVKDFPHEEKVKSSHSFIHFPYSFNYK